MSSRLGMKMSARRHLLPERSGEPPVPSSAVPLEFTPGDAVAAGLRGAEKNGVGRPRHLAPFLMSLGEVGRVADRTAVVELPAGGGGLPDPDAGLDHDPLRRGFHEGV